jgi:hypothetical protein
VPSARTAYHPTFLPLGSHAAPTCMSRQFVRFPSSIFGINLNQVPVDGGHNDTQTSPMCGCMLRLTSSGGGSSMASVLLGFFFWGGCRMASFRVNSDSLAPPPHTLSLVYNEIILETCGARNSLPSSPNTTTYHASVVRCRCRACVTSLPISPSRRPEPGFPPPPQQRMSSPSAHHDTELGKPWKTR